jgi:RNA polymerase sigma factor (sigma-70 family)
MPVRDVLLRLLLRSAGAAAGAVPSDGELLDCFARGRDDSAFQELLRRHTPLVLGVCRRILHQEQDAEDAFQATFLVLASRADSICQRESLASWLHGVAYRCAARVRSSNARRRRHEGQVLPSPATVLPPDPSWGEVRQALDEELARLPEKYRAPLVLCYLRGMTQCEAARELGCKTGVLRGRLDRGRERLRARLARRGLALSAGLLAAGLGPETASANSAALVDSTLKAARVVAAREALTGVSGNVAVLTKGALKTMLWTKARIVVLSVLALGALGIGAVVARQTVAARAAVHQEAGPPAARAARPPGKAETPGPQEKRREFEMREQPWAKVFEWYSNQTGLGYVGTVKPTGTFTFIPPRGKRTYTLAEITDILNEALLARKYLLLRRTATFTVLPADEKVDPTLVPRVRLGDLEKRGRTELVSVVLPLTRVRAKEVGGDVKKMLGPFGEVVVVEKGNLLLLQDTAGNLRRITQTIKDMETREAEKRPLSK